MSDIIDDVIGRSVWLVKLAVGESPLPTRLGIGVDCSGVLPSAELTMRDGEVGAGTSEKTDEEIFVAVDEASVVETSSPLPTSKAVDVERIRLDAGSDGENSNNAEVVPSNPLPSNELVDDGNIVGTGTLTVVTAREEIGVRDGADRVDSPLPSSSTVAIDEVAKDVVRGKET